MSKRIRIGVAGSGQLRGVMPGADADSTANWRAGTNWAAASRIVRLVFAIVVGFAVAPAASAQAQTLSVHPLIPTSNFVVNISDAHWQVALVDGSDRRLSLFCGGSLVAPNWVVTAAQCVDSFVVQRDPSRLGVIAGTLTYKTGGVRSDVDKIFAHPRWKQSGTEFDFDATLLKLKTPVTSVAPIKLIAPTSTLPVGPSVRVTGWGAISKGGPASDKLLFVDVPVITNAECNKPEKPSGCDIVSRNRRGERNG